MTHDRRRFLRLTVSGAASFALASLRFGQKPASAATRRLKIGTVGSGRVGATLGGIWVKAGHEVMFSSLDLEHDKSLAASLGRNARAGTPREAAAFGEVLLVSVPYSALPAVGRDLADLIKGKVVIDTCNPFVSQIGRASCRERV